MGKERWFISPERCSVLHPQILISEALIVAAKVRGWGSCPRENAYGSPLRRPSDTFEVLINVARAYHESWRRRRRRGGIPMTEASNNAGAGWCQRWEVCFRIPRRLNATHCTLNSLGIPPSYAQQHRLSGQQAHEFPAPQELCCGHLHIGEQGRRAGLLFLVLVSSWCQSRWRTVITNADRGIMATADGCGP